MSPSRTTDTSHEHSGEQDASGHDGHEDRGHGGHGDHVAMFRRLFWVALVLAIPAVALSQMFADLVGYRVPDLPGVAWVPPILGSVIYLWAGRPFLSGG